jgi:hypothetical protein
MSIGSDLGGRPLRGRGRALLVLWSILLLAGFSLALCLPPDPQGYGTHQQLGLPPCTFQFFFNIPCPSCGMTTCFAHFVRGQWVAAFHANAAGLLLACVCLAQIPWSLTSAWKGRLWGIDSPEPVAIAVLSVLIVASLLNWCHKLGLLGLW